ncbi:PLP-dependent aminotransferase family protein [Streptomyces sp. SAJ15]|uniref:aminotransferase-like domain-containing protein n=1 Tax=Streptomyces sp. SAJ15 TaxID=2011095 RepID=UPI0011848C6F|nr:PLP-dependent aminotransferase family protein [Streptomyces sp. SAJ15]TVL88610.1 GntR family transcriptional regulator [Streptomyces sp. SAJ15]
MDLSREPARLVELLPDNWAHHGALYRGLADALARLIDEDDLVPDARLPSERGLAAALSVSRSTVVAAYDELRAAGVLVSRRGSGTRVVRQAGGGRSRPDHRLLRGAADSVFARLSQGPGSVISLAYAADAGAPELVDALQEVMAQDLPHLLEGAGYHPRGLPGLRERIAAHLTGLGLPTAPEAVVVTTGAHQAIALAARMYLRAGSTVVVESPSWPGCFDLFSGLGARVVGVPLDEEGMRPDLLAATLDECRPDLLFVMPCYHNPTGRLMSAARRRRIVELAGRHGVVVIEDLAYSGRLGPAAELPPPMSAFAAPDDEVLTIGSLSKSVWGGLRVGWVRADVPVAARLARHKALADLGTPALDQAIAARLLPRLAELEHTRAQSAARRLRHLTGLLAGSVPDWRWDPPDGGSALWIELPGVDARVFAQVALRHGVEVVPGRATDPSGRHDTYIRLPFTYPVDVLTEAVGRLARAWADLRRHGPTPGGSELLV